MGLEVATYIEDLVQSNPLGTDPVSSGDNHLRLIKKVLQKQFPNLGQAAVNATAADLNEIFDNNRLVPSGLISMWSGSVAALPTGWKICNGTNGTPNLVGRFVIGSDTDFGGSYNVGDTGGTATHTHTGSVGNHTLTIDQIPAHTHSTLFNNENGIDNDSFGNGSRYKSGGGFGTGSAGGGQPHNHPLTINATSNLPPYYALAFIMKI